ncbi:hypothetical protein [Maribacter polysaccharolyticus]|uniref:hypothetical protein n=1 Tax=Maribacter polysaccharolyticus TaxID=3020831 RepID=UPI00237F54A9|nr:hypothetical protein [Maribacter polysaccharolyticus]MDE3740754.1 hypothetical protein [Maribacter polysaccharolyticus]
MMINYKNIAIVIFLLFSTTLIFGQRKPDRSKIRTLKIAYISEQLDFTSKEAEAFWPIYNSYQDKMDTFRDRERNQIYAKVKDMDSRTEKEVNALLDDLIALEDEKNMVSNQFLKDIRKVISAKKTFLLLKSENGFKRHLLQQYRQKKRDGPQ